MHVDEVALAHALGGEEPRDSLLGGRARHEIDFALCRLGLDADAAQRVEVLLDHVAMAVARERILVREAAAPERAAPGLGRRDGMARPERAREPGAARL